MKRINYLDGFSGYGGFHLGLERAGFKFKNVYYSEIDKHAIANYSYNFKDSIYAGSIDTICEGGIVRDIDLFTFGWPCQDNSIAGKRKGQRAGTRSGLLFESVKILNHFKPRHFIAENVLGLLTVNKGIDIIESLEVLAYLNESCPQYDIEMQLLNTRWFLPQNRERLYFVGHLRGRGGRKIFPVGEGCEQDYKVQGQSGVSCCLTTRYGTALGQGSYIIERELDEVFAYTEKRTDEAKAIRRENQRNGRDFSPRRGKYLAPRNDGMMNTLTTSPTNEHIINYQGNLRKLTPIECERLQGLPDEWTKFGLYGGIVKEMSDSNRYKLCGNGVSVPIVESIGKKLILNYETNS